MKKILSMIITPNGFIAKENDEAPWSLEAFAAYNNLVKQTGNLIIGRKTYEIIRDAGEIDSTVVTIVVTSAKKENENNIFFVSSPKEAIELLEQKSFSTALIAGGAELNKSFLTENLIDEICLDIEPRLWGKGIPLFSFNDFECELKLLETSKIGESTVRVRYEVVK